MIASYYRQDMSESHVGGSHLTLQNRVIEPFIDYMPYVSFQLSTVWRPFHNIEILVGARFARYMVKHWHEGRIWSLYISTNTIPWECSSTSRLACFEWCTAMTASGHDSSSPKKPHYYHFPSQVFCNRNFRLVHYMLGLKITFVTCSRKIGHQHFSVDIRASIRFFAMDRLQVCRKTILAEQKIEFCWFL